jgi:hypothetical protein
MQESEISYFGSRTQYFELTFWAWRAFAQNLNSHTRHWSPAVCVHFENCAMWLIGVLFLVVYTAANTALWLAVGRKALHCQSKDDNARIFAQSSRLASSLLPCVRYERNLQNQRRKLNQIVPDSLGNLPRDVWNGRQQWADRCPALSLVPSPVTGDTTITQLLAKISFNIRGENCWVKIWYRYDKKIYRLSGQKLRIFSQKLA